MAPTNSTLYSGLTSTYVLSLASEMGKSSPTSSQPPSSYLASSPSYCSSLFSSASTPLSLVRSLCSPSILPTSQTLISTLVSRSQQAKCTTPLPEKPSEESKAAQQRVRKLRHLQIVLWMLIFCIVWLCVISVWEAQLNQGYVEWLVDKLVFFLKEREKKS
jgi:hypothetical protein